MDDVKAAKLNNEQFVVTAADEEHGLAKNLEGLLNLFWLLFNACRAPSVHPMRYVVYLVCLLQTHD